MNASNRTHHIRQRVHTATYILCFSLIDPFCERHRHTTTTLQPNSLVKILGAALFPLFSFSLASNINVVFSCSNVWLVRPVVSREKEKIRFSVSLFFSFYLNLCSSSKLASCFGLRRCWRHVMEEEENEDEHVKTRSMCVYKHIILLHYSFFSIYLYVSFSNMYKNKFVRAHDYIINPKW